LPLGVIRLHGAAQIGQGADLARRPAVCQVGAVQLAAYQRPAGEGFVHGAQISRHRQQGPPDRRRGALTGFPAGDGAFVAPEQEGRLGGLQAGAEVDQRMQLLPSAATFGVLDENLPERVAIPRI